MSNKYNLNSDPKMGFKKVRFNLIFIEENGFYASFNNFTSAKYMAFLKNVSGSAFAYI